MAKLVDALDLGSSVERHAGSIPVLGTNNSDQWPVVSCQKLMIATDFFLTTDHRRPATDSTFTYPFDILSSANE